MSMRCISQKHTLLLITTLIYCQVMCACSKDTSTDPKIEIQEEIEPAVFTVCPVAIEKTPTWNPWVP